MFKKLFLINIIRTIEKLSFKTELRKKIDMYTFTLKKVTQYLKKCM